MALIFLLFGTVVSCGFFVLISTGNSLAGAGDGASSGSITRPDNIIIPYACYFVSGTIACLIPWRTARWFLVTVGHISPFAVFVEMKDINIGIMKLFLIINLLIFIPFSFAWYTLLSRSKDATE